MNQSYKTKKTEGLGLNTNLEFEMDNGDTSSDVMKCLFVREGLREITESLIEHGVGKSTITLLATVQDHLKDESESPLGVEIFDNWIDESVIEIGEGEKFYFFPD